MAGNEWWIIKIIDNRKVSALGTLTIPSDFYSRLQFIYVGFFFFSSSNSISFITQKQWSVDALCLFNLCASTKLFTVCFSFTRFTQLLWKMLVCHLQHLGIVHRSVMLRVHRYFDWVRYCIYVLQLLSICSKPCTHFHDFHWAIQV